MGPLAAVFLYHCFDCDRWGHAARVDPLTSIAALVHLVEGIPFAATLLFILTVHEFGHYFAARRWGVRASLPYFLPLPYVSFLGTLGAVIKIRSPSQQARPSSTLVPPAP